MLFRPYDRLEAVIYAHRWAYGRNPAFYDYEEIGGDCTNYASQCIYAGTGVMNLHLPSAGTISTAITNRPPGRVLNFCVTFWCVRNALPGR